MIMSALYWEHIADSLSRAGWSWGMVGYWSETGQRMHCLDAHMGDGRRFIVRADDLLAGFVELEAACRNAAANSP